MNRLYPLTYNNYYNRIVKKENTVTGYASHVAAGASYLPSIDFNPNDGIDTTQVIGTGSTPYVGEIPDYIVITDTLGTSIVSRWFVIEAKRLRAGQYKLTLHRDCFADYYNNVLVSPAFIAKGFVSWTDSAIFNRENMTFNEIKSSETLIKDETDHGWIVGYVAKLTSDKNVNLTADNFVVSGTYASFAEMPKGAYAQARDKAGNVVNTGEYTLQGLLSKLPAFRVALGNTYRFTLWNNGGDYKYDGTLGVGYSSSWPSERETLDAVIAAISPKAAKIGESIAREIKDNAVNLEDMVGKYYKVNNKFYQVIELERKYEANTLIDITSSSYYDSYTIMSQAMQNVQYVSGSPTNKSFAVHGTASKARIILQEVDNGANKVTIPAGARNLNDAPYKMFCLPYGGSEYVNAGTYYISKSQAIKWAANLQEQLGASCYDVQILPYCPRRDFIVGNYFYVGHWSKDYGAENVDYSLIKDSNNVTLGAIVWCVSSQFSFENNFNFAVSTNDVEFKVDNETRFLRIVSPNYNGQFDITPEKNGGINGLQINCAYKPFNPFIQVIPEFGRLYGGNFGDARGLICAGDWSLPQVSDAWINYELNNKNYQQSFDRQTQSLELRNKYNKMGDIVGAIGGTASGTASGAIAGAQMGGGYGAIAGAVIGGAGSAIAGAVDVGISETLRQDALDLRRDLFGMSLANIQAVPDSLTRISAINPNFKIFPFIEEFRATEEERQALRDKIKYDGMTIGRIGTINGYKQAERKMFKGTFIRIEGISEDYHLLKVMNMEFERGVFI